MKKYLVSAIFGCALLAALPRVQAVPVACIACGSTFIVGAGVEGTVSYAVISGASFAAEKLAHGIGFGGLVPSGTLGPAVVPPPTDFVYLYQLVNNGPSADFISSLSISGGGVGPGGITAGTRLESTLFVDPGVGLVSAGPVVGPTTPGLAGGPLVDFENGLGLPVATDPVPNWGPCLGSGPSGVQCSDALADLLPTSVLVHGWGEAPAAPLLDPTWSGSIVWFASPFAPVLGTASITTGPSTASGAVFVPGVPEPGVFGLLALGLAGIGWGRWSHRRLKP